MNVSRITIGRLYNLGNYEHIRYDISVELGPEEAGKASSVLESLSNIIAALNPGEHLSDYAMIRFYDLERRQTEGEELSRFDLQEVKRLRAAIAAEEAQRETRKKALQALNTLGGSMVFTDAKERWE